MSQMSTYGRRWFNKRNVTVCKSCKDELSITVETIFHKSKLSLVIIFRTLWWMLAQKNGVSAVSLQRVLGIGSYRTVWTWLHKFRQLMVSPSRDRLSGNIEVDETLVICEVRWIRLNDTNLT